MITRSLKQSPRVASTAAGPAHSVLVNASTNRISSAGFSHDPNGNLTAMPQTGGGTLHLTYDLSNRVTNLSHNGWSEDYLYSPDNRRIWRSAGRIASSTHIDDEQNLSWFPAANEIGPHYILYTPSGQKLGVYSVRFSPSGQYNVWTASEENVYWGSRLVAKRIGVGPMGHFITDRLHSKGDGSAFYPYGESKTGAAGDDREQFATYTRDQSSGLDYADQRWYSSRLGRFLTTDPLDSSFSDARPASANRYSYVESDPSNLIDPTGLLLELPGGSSSRTFDPCYLDGRDFCGGTIGGGGGGPVLSSPQDLALAYGIVAPGQSLAPNAVNWDLLGSGIANALSAFQAGYSEKNPHLSILFNLAANFAHSVVPVVIALPTAIEIGVAIHTAGGFITVGILVETIKEYFKRRRLWTVSCKVHPVPSENHEAIAILKRYNVPGSTAGEAIKNAEHSMEVEMFLRFGQGHHLQHCDAW